MGSKTEAVRSVFGEPSWYLKGTCNIRIRVETVQEFLKDESLNRILDIGCGDGSISLPLLSSHRHLTLLDFSEGMLSVARSRVPAELVGNVEFRNENFMDAKLSPGEYDLIICIGVLAHADAPEALISKIVSLMRPGGNLILEQTDASHFMSGLTYLMEKYFFVPEKYERNRISSVELRRIVAKCGLDLLASFRYSLLFPGMHRLVSQNVLYKMIRLVYGSYPHARLSHLGNECIYRLKSTARLLETSRPIQRLN
ncbi:MAG: class I SAM-dependent methyltransferase [Terriglobia bacterium]|jgi:ubiquinone/menaquinone biosynthesis C-methylase UbiE